MAQKAKDAIVDGFRERHGKRPSVDLDNPTVRINLFINQDKCLVSLDSSGNSLHKRDYRRTPPTWHLSTKCWQQV